MLKRTLLALPVLAALAAGSASAQAPRQLAIDGSDNHQLAQAVARTLSSSGKLNQYTLDINVQAGRVELLGQVASPEQAAEAGRLANSVPGVKEVVNKLAVPGMMNTVGHSAMQQPPAAPPAQPAPPPWAANEPIPSFSAGVAAGMGFHTPAPPLPPYAWPTYAPHNNFSRVGHPNVYPMDAMPYIGPFSPFPRAPLGWRNVTLSFDDGFWYLSSHAGNRDWWSVRYW